MFNFLSRITVDTKKHLKIDEQEAAALQLDRDRFLYQALDGYLQCLVRGDLHDLRISRVLALWFENSAVEKINNMIGVRFKLNTKQQKISLC